MSTAQPTHSPARLSVQKVVGIMRKSGLPHSKDLGLSRCGNGHSTEGWRVIKCWMPWSENREVRIEYDMGSWFIGDWKSAESTALQKYLAACQAAGLNARIEDKYVIVSEQPPPRPPSLRKPRTTKGR